MIKKFYNEQLDIVTIINDIQNTITEYLPTVYTRELPEFASTGQYFLTLDHAYDAKMNQLRLIESLFIALKPLYEDIQSIKIIVYQKSPKRTILLINSNSDDGRSMYLAKTGLLCENRGLPLPALLISTLSIPLDILNIAITEISRKEFARQYIYYVGCHGYMRYPEWHYYLDPRDGDERHGFVSDVREQSYNTYIAKYWRERESSGCLLDSHCKNDGRNVCCDSAPHHLCRERNNRDCIDLNECQCSCDKCEEGEDDHQCSTPDEWLCFKHWKPPV